MLHEFLSSNREEFISRCKVKVSKRSAPKLTEKLQFGVPVLLTQLVDILIAEDRGLNVEDPSVSWDTTEAATGIGKTASKHGNELFLKGFTVDQVVHGYGDLCQAVTELAIETNAPITNIEFRTLNLCLDNAIAAAVSEYSRGSDPITTDETIYNTMDGSQTVFEGQLNLIRMAIAAKDAIKSGYVGISGATGGVLDRSLNFLLDLTVRAFEDDRTKAGSPKQSREGGHP
jgi:hypothetical protein